MLLNQQWLNWFSIYQFSLGIITHQEDSKYIDRLSTEKNNMKTYLVFDALEVGCAYKKENMRQEILPRDYNTVRQDNVIIILFVPL